jgi:predicted dehydrogenase
MEMRVAVVGVGAMGQLFARLLTELPNARLCGVADVLVERAEKAGDQFQVPSFANIEDLLGGTNPDAVVIASADDQHVGPVRAAARANKAIFLEKPLASSVADGRAILTELAETGVRLMVAHCVRFDPRYAMARRAIQAGQLGQLLHLSTRRVSRLAASRHIFGRCSLSKFLSVHDIDYLLWATGQPVTEVHAVAHRQRLDGVEVDASVLALLTFADGTIAALETCWAAPIPSWHFEAVGSDGLISINSPEAGSMLYSRDAAQFFNAFYSSVPVVEGQTLNVYQAELMHFLTCVSQDRPFVVQPD